jgi:TonB-dependent starch-binding outer membrane protein SusC
MKRLLLILLLTLSGGAVLLAQRTLTGKVTDNATGEGLIGVTILVKDGAAGTVTDAEGNFSLNAPSNAQVLVVSYTGYDTKEVSIGSSNVIDVILAQGVTALTEAIVTGYGTQIKRTLTGNIARIKGTEIQDMPITSLDQALQGKAAGVLVNAGSAKLGQGIRVNVRGQSSVSASNQPLYVIDGIPLTVDNLSYSGGATNPLADINPQDIESLEILKDASAAAIYGARAANGVVIITTKRGSTNKTKVQFGASYGESTPTRQVEFLNTEQYVRLYRQAAAASDRIDELDPKDPDSYTTYMENFFKDQSLGTFTGPNGPTTDWGALAYQKAPMRQYDLGVSGGDAKTQFYVSGQFLDQTGIILGNSLNRVSGRINLDHQASKRLKIGVNASQARTLNRRISGDRQFDNPIQMVALPPMSPSTDPATGLPIGTPPGDISLPAYYNPMINIGNAYYNTTVNRNISTAYGQFEIAKGLKFRSEIGLDLLSQYEEQYYNSKTRRNFGAPGGLGRRRQTTVENLNTNNYFNYNLDVLEEKLNLDLTAGMSFQRSVLKRSFVEGQDFPSDAYKMLASAARTTGGSSAQSNFAFASYFGRGNFRFLDRYIIGVSGRVDGSSRFGANSRYGFFPAVSGAWIITEEGFLKDSEAFSFLKLRGSWGLTGNADIITAGSQAGTVDNFPQLGLFAGDAGYGGLAGQRPSQLANPDLSWETTAQTDVGIDFGFLNNRLSGEIDVYWKTSSGLLLNVNVPATTGFATQARNVGGLTNQGIEFVLNTNNTTGAFKWTTSLNFAANRNKITDLDGQIIEGGLNNMSRAIEGEPIGTFFTAEYAGVDPANGNALWYKNTKLDDGSLDRATTSVYNQAQRVVFGSALPDWIGGVTNTFGYKGVELSLFFNGQFGNEINFYGVGRFSSANARFEDNQTVDQLNAWTKDNPNTNVPEARLFFNNGAQPSTRFILDGSFVRLRTATLSYTLPKNLLSKAKISGMRIYLTGQNLLTFTDYAGWDPEVNADDIVTNIAQGYDFYTAPQARTIIGGLNVTF